MTHAALPATLLWVVDREALENGVVPPALRAGARWLYLRDASVEAGTWRSQLTGWSACGAFIAVAGGGPRWARLQGLGAHLKAAQPALASADREGWPLLGRSVHDPAEARAALADRPDYLLAGPLFPTPSKPGHAGIGAAGLAAIVKRAGHTPVLAVGGITPTNLAAAIAAGAAGVAVRSGITASADPVSAVAAYTRALEVALGVDPHQS